MKALNGIEIYVSGMLEEVYHDLSEVPDDLTEMKSLIKRTELEAKKEAYQEVLQYIKEGSGIL